MRFPILLGFHFRCNAFKQGTDTTESCRVLARQNMIYGQYFDLETVSCENSFCTNLLWTDATRTGVKFGNRRNGLREWYPVSCREASYSLARQGSGPITGGQYHDNPASMERRSRVPDVCEVFASLQAIKTEIARRVECSQGRCIGISRSNNPPSLIRLGDDSGSPISCYEALSVVLAFKINGIKVYEPPQATSKGVILHYHKRLFDERPRVGVKFLVQAGFNTSPFSMLLDSGADKSYVVIRNPTCDRASAGYFDDGKAYQNIQERKYGDDAGVSTVKIIEEISEQALVGEFVFTTKLGLAEVCTDEYVSTGLFGAASTSDFARAVGVFAVVPPQQRRIHLKSPGSAGTLLIGPQDWRTHCRDGQGPTFIPLSQQISKIHWTVTGGITVGGSTIVPIIWVIDTGSTGLMVTWPVYQQIVAGIQRAGGNILSIAPSRANLVDNCVNNYARFPALTVVVGFGSGAFTSTLEPSSYLSHFDNAVGSCYLTIDFSTQEGMPNTGFLGEGFLFRTTTIFDSNNAHVGFCTSNI
jgi:hypothetical protein